MILKEHKTIKILFSIYIQYIVYLVYMYLEYMFTIYIGTYSQTQFLKELSQYFF